METLKNSIKRSFFTAENAKISQSTKRKLAPFAKILTAFAVKTLACVCILMTCLITRLYANTITTTSFSYTELFATTKTPKKLSLTKRTSAYSSTYKCSESVDKSKLYLQLTMGDDFHYSNLTFSVTVKLKVTPYKKDNTVISSGIKSYSIDVSNTSPEKWITADFTAYYSNMSYYKIEIVSAIGSTLDFFNDNLKLNCTADVSYKINAINPAASGYTYKYVTVNKSSASAPTTLNWNCNCEFPLYQIQVLKLYNNDDSYYAEGSDASGKYKLKANVNWAQALTFETQEKSLTLTLSEGEGWYIWRVRPIGNKYDDLSADDRNWGQWSSAPESGTLILNEDNTYSGASPKSYALYYTDDDLYDKNWIYSRVFDANEDKKEGITYYNSIGLIDQQQVFRSTDENPIVSKTLYDEQGRPAVNTLAIPVEQSNMNYVEGLVKNAVGEEYSASDFDPGYDASNPQPISDGLIQDYYSDENSDISIPTADGYPFSQTTYYGDGTDRVKEIALPGYQTSLAGENTVKLYYDNPTSNELTRVFGNEAYKVSAAYKITSVSPNNVANVSYYDKKNNLIATAISARHENAKLDEISEENSGTTTYSIDLSENMESASSGYKLQAQTYINCSEPTTYKISYKININEISEECVDFCATCDYNVWLTFIRVDSYDHESKDIELLSIGSESCDGSSNQKTYSGEITLDAGYYQVVKSITTNNADEYNPSSLRTHIENLEESFETKYSEEYNTLLTHLEDEDLDGFYAALSSYGYVKTGNWYNRSEDCFNAQTIPIYNCSESTSEKEICDPDNWDMEAYTQAKVLSIISDELEESTNEEVKSKLTELQDQINSEGIYFMLTLKDVGNYSSGQLNQVFKNMMDDTDAGYDCESLKSCWQTIVQSMVDMYVKNGLDGIGHYDPVGSFLECSGKSYQGFSSDDETVKNNPHKYFKYTDGDCDYCESVFEFGEGKWPDLRDGYTVFTIDDKGSVFGDGEAFNYSKASNLGLDFEVKDYNNRPWECFYDYKKQLEEEHPQPIKVQNNLSEKNAENEIANNFSLYKYRAEKMWKEAAVSYTEQDVEARANLLAEHLKSQTNLTLQGMSDIEGDKVDVSLAYKIGNNYINVLSIGSMYMVDVITNETKDAYIIHEGKYYGPYTGNGLYFYALSANFSVSPAVEYGTNIQLIAVTPNYSAVCTDEEEEKYNKALSGLFKISYTNDDDTYTSELKKTYLSSTDMLNNGDFTAYTSTDGVLSFDQWEKIYDEAELDQSNSEDYRILLDSKWNDEGTLEGDGIKYVSSLSLSKDATYILSLDYEVIPFYEEEYEMYSPQNSIDNLYVVLTSTASKDDAPPVPCLNDQVIYQGTNLFTLEEQNIRIPFTYSNTENKTLVVYVRQNAGSGPAKLAVDNISLLSTTSIITSLNFKWIDKSSSTDTDSGKDSVITLSEHMSCEDRNIYKLKSILDEIYNAELTDLKNDFRSNYKSTCADPENIEDELTLYYEDGYYHYTLYYYDHNNRLLKTVPPKGVDANDSYTTSSSPGHSMETEYAYNSLNQLQSKETPDGGKIQYWYNSKGQIRASQNAMQAAQTIQQFSYTKYDKLGRIIESGIYKDLDNIKAILQTELEDDSWPDEGTKTEKNFTVYTTKTDITYYGKSQRFLTGNISYTHNDDSLYTYFSYDANGNVEWVVQQIPGLYNEVSGTGLAYIGYKYDPITGLVTQINYNEEGEDRYFKRFNYDADKRLISMETSSDKVIWEKDAAYEYYAHGPLKRTELGEDGIQGLDYTYTIQGWLKAMNTPLLDINEDPGLDNYWGVNNDNKYIPADQFGMALHYYDGDFDREYSASISPFHSETSTADLQPSINLYDGSITAMETNIGYVSGSLNYEQQVAEQYNYDHLLRLKKSTFYSLDEVSPEEKNWQSHATNDYTIPAYSSAYRYDANGNISHLQRTDENGGELDIMDNLNYTYQADNNRLDYIEEKSNSKDYATSDLENQNPTNYSYDELGRITADVSEGLTFEWNSLHKIKKATKTTTDESTSETKTQITEFVYDALGNRAIKKVTNTDGSITKTFYVKDAKGMLMAKYKYEDHTGVYTLQEIPLSAGNQIGLYQPNKTVTPGKAITEPASYSRTLGKKSYELHDHLGNVRVVVSDAKQATATGGIPAYSYTAKVQSYSNYYPYGMEMPGRCYSSSDYKYGYQGKEKDDELKGSGNSYDFGARILDPRVGRWLSTDPLDSKFPSMSPYNAMGNDPINLVDPDGRVVEGYLKISIAVGPEASVKLNVTNAAKVDGKVGASNDLATVEVTASKEGGVNVRITQGGVIKTFDAKAGAELQISIANASAKASANFTVNLETGEIKAGNLDVTGKVLNASGQATVDKNGKVNSEFSVSEGKTTSKIKDDGTESLAAGVTFPLANWGSVRIEGGLRTTDTPVTESLNEFDDPCSGYIDYVTYQADKIVIATGGEPAIDTYCPDWEDDFQE